MGGVYRIQTFLGFFIFFLYLQGPLLTYLLTLVISHWNERRSSVVVSTPAWHAGDLGSIPGPDILYFRCKNLTLNISDRVFITIE